MSFLTKPVDEDIILEHADALIEYADCGAINDVEDLSALIGPFSGTIYRGLYLPKEWLVPGAIIEEWGGSSHWSRSEEVAKRFSTSMDGEDFMLEYGEDKGFCDMSEILSLFEPVILVMDKFVQAIDLGANLDILERNGYDVGSVFLSGKNDEQEVSVVGYNFRVENVWGKSGQCFAYVSPIEIKKDLSLVDSLIESAEERAADAADGGKERDLEIV